ncbi:MAG TPA: glycoside hydrolase family 2 TIM barrel-domain containing protein [Anaerohalosphaeraceae bacterium]|nr:glycoside hydrolase family 2 TIM barrel-domain containing protein [Anaerohalosphaeraceae bacterium]
MKSTLSVMILAGAVLLSSSCGRQSAGIQRGKRMTEEQGRIVRNFNSGWRFCKGEQPAQAAQTDFDDSKWEAVRLPHDWAIRGPFNPEEHGYAGKLPWKGVGWYRKTFELPAHWQGRRVYLDFDGVMAFPKVYVNGQLAGEWDYGYMSFRIDATPYVKFGQKNLVAVRVDTRNQGTRWYPGAGIYRKVTMTVCNPVHIGHWATFITTPQVADHQAAVNIQTVLENHLGTPQPATLQVVIRDPKGNTAAQGMQEIVLPADSQQEISQSLQVLNPVRWDITSPNLYTAQVSIQTRDKLLDAETISFGIRTFEFTADDGFHLNGRRVQIHGVNLHHDHGPLGAAFYRRAMERQLEIMRDIGVNAVRTSHNPPAPELLELCDRMGFIVWDECFDKWDDKAGRVDGQPPLEEYGHKQIRNFVMRDRNHPCVVVWSIGNEIGNLPGTREGKSGPRVKMMRDFVLKYDTTRPVGIADCIPETANEPILDALDLVGWNYDRRYSIFRERYPHKPIVYSESASALSTRGFYELPLPTTKTDYSSALQVDSYDLNAAPWSDIPDREFALMERDSFVAGEMVWTGFDYLGEPTPFDEEARSSYFGIVDLCGIPKDRYYLYRSYWRPEATTVHILPHWNWPDRIGKNVPVFVYTNGDSAELFLNGKSLGRRVKGQVPERPVNLAEGKPVSASSVQTEQGHPAEHAVDGDSQTRWCASSAAKEEWLAVDLGSEQPIHRVLIEFEREAKNYGCRIEISSDGTDWKTAAEKATSTRPHYGGPREHFFAVDAKARHLRVVFTDFRNNCWASIRRLGVYSKEVESDYYLPTYRYRLRWNDIVYEPGELKAVAYKDGNVIGEAVMRTAGAPARLRLTPDRTILAATGEDLSYILVEALDADGNLCPLADNLVRFSVRGPAEIAGVGNGNPMSFEPFQADYRKLFYGKAMLIIRTLEGRTGNVRIQAASDGLQEAVAELKVQ